MKKAIVTGGAGFVGSNLIKTLLQRGVDVISIDNYLSGSFKNHYPDARYITGCASNISSFLLDVQNIDIVFHLGEYSRVLQSLHEPDLCLENTVRTLPAILHFCRERKSKLIYSGSSTKFGDAESLYSLAKKSNTELVNYYCKKFDVDHAITYFYNVYGDGEISQGKYSTVIAKFIELKRQNAVAQIHKPGTQTRNFTHVNDIIAGLLLVAEKGYGDNFGIGNEFDEYNIIDLAKLVGVQYELTDSVAGNRFFSELNIEKITGLGWRPSHNLQDYLQSL
jgi:UDP-glucose 4-epimerase